MERSDFKMEDFMDVVYKCKFCPYSCTQSPDMGLHVKEKHLKQPPTYAPLLVKTTAVSTLPPNDFLYSVGGSTQLTIADGSVLSHSGKNNFTIQESQDILTFTDAEGQAYMDKSLPRAVAVTESTSQTLVNDIATTVPGSDLTELIVVKGKDLGMGVPSSQTSSTSSVVSMMDCPSSHQMGAATHTVHGIMPPPTYSSSSLSLPSSLSASLSSTLSSSTSLLPPPPINSNAHTIASSQAMSVMAIQLPSFNSDCNSSQQFIVQAGDSNIPMGLNDTAETKEFLLCGLCKLAFTSMEDCQAHMQAEHKELIQGLGVSVGVQVGGGKRGRKRKTEMQQQTEEHVKVKDEPPESLDYDDLEWLPSVPEGKQTTHRDGRTRRKVIPPKALKEDYVLGRRMVKKRNRKNNDSLGYNVVCPMMNCKARFKTKESMELHLSSHNLDDAAFTCPECKASHDFWKHLRIHLWKVHKIDVDLLTCDKCDYKTDTSHKMSVHKEIHADTKPYKCTICNKGFRQAAQQKNHMTIHRNPGSKADSSLWFVSKKCDICERVFANSKCLTKHKEAVHSKLKPFQCSFCGHTTARKAMMELHVRTHTGEKPFKCEVCAYTTGDHNSMRRHKMRHTGEKQYRCSMCPYTCIQSISLKQHIKNKHPGASSGIFQCSRCSFRSINQNHFDSHMLDHKKGLIPDAPPTLKVNETKPKKLSQKQPSGGSKARPPVNPQIGLQTIIQKHPQFHTVLPDSTTTTGQTTLETVTVGTLSSEAQTDAFNMQVTMLPGGDTQVNAEDMTRLSENPNLLALNISALQLIYATLSTISEQTDLSCVEEGRSSLLTIELVGGIQTSVLSSVQENAIVHSITYHIPVPATSNATMTNIVQTQGPHLSHSLTTTKPTSTVPSSMINSLGIEAGEKIELVMECGGVEEAEEVNRSVAMGKAESVINVEGIEMLDSGGMSSSEIDNTSRHRLSSLPAASISADSSSTLMVPNSSNAMIGKVDSRRRKAYQNQNIALLETASSADGNLAGNLVPSSFLGSSLPPGFINLVGTSLKTSQSQQDLTLEVVGPEEEKSVFLIGEDSDGLVVGSSQSDTDSQTNNNDGDVQLHNAVVDGTGQTYTEDDTGSDSSRYIVLDQKPMELEAVNLGVGDVVVAQNSSNDNNLNLTTTPGATYLKLPEHNSGKNVVNNGVMVASNPGRSVIMGNNSNTIVSGYTTLMNSVPVGDVVNQPSHMTLINAPGATASIPSVGTVPPTGVMTSDSSNNNNFVHLIPISFLDQNNDGQELSPPAANTVYHQTFIPSSNACG